MAQVTFYKGVLLSDLKQNYIPGTVTRNLDEAVLWKERAESKKTKGIHRHVRKGKATIIVFTVDSTRLLGHEEFQRPGISEHQRQSCWTSADRTKAQINFPINFSLVE